MFCSYGSAATQNWENIDRQIRDKIFQINVGINVRLKNGPWAQLTSLSPRRHYYVFTTNRSDQGYQIVGHGSCFPLATPNKQKVFFITCEHVLDEAAEAIEECQMFYAAMQLYACETTVDNNVEPRLKELLNTVNLGLKKDPSPQEKNAYTQTVDTIWDYYDNNLSPQADPWRRAYNKYKTLAGLQVKTAYLLHAPGPVTQPPVEVTVYKASTHCKPDLAILTAKPADRRSIDTLDLDPTTPRQGQEIQSAGYPLATQTIDMEPAKSYEPIFTNGKILHIETDGFEFDASINKGNSGGPVISNKGQVLGVVMRKPDFRQHQGTCDLYGGSAISARSIRSFVPELFQTR